MIKKILLTGVFALLVTSAFGEYYQYTDESGNVRFTDDLYQVPEAQRSGVTTFESETSAPDETAAGDVSPENEETGAVEPSETEETDQRESNAESSEGTGEGAAEGALQSSAIELNEMQAKLNQTGIELQKEREALKAQAPKGKVRTNERIEYSAKVDALNAKIVKYENDLKAFDEKVAVFNAGKNKKTQ